MKAAFRVEARRYEDKAISIVTWMEVMVGAPLLANRATRAFLDGFALVELNEAVAERAVALRRKHPLKLPGQSGERKATGGGAVFLGKP